MRFVAHLSGSSPISRATAEVRKKTAESRERDSIRTAIDAAIRQIAFYDPELAEISADRDHSTTMLAIGGF